MLAKCAYWVFAVLVCLVVGMIFPGIGHALLAYAAWKGYHEIFKD